MSYIANRPALIVEGHGDVSSLPALLRRIADSKEHFMFNPLTPTIRCGGLSRIQRGNELERFVTLARLRNERDSILIALDCDDTCPISEVRALTPRLQSIAENFDLKIAIAFFVREFESLFIHCLDELATRYPNLGISADRVPHPDIESIRDAKGFLDRMMVAGSYKPSRDQARYVHALDLHKLELHSRCYRHLCSCIDFLVNPTSALIYPA